MGKSLTKTEGLPAQVRRIREDVARLLGARESDVEEIVVDANAPVNFAMITARFANGDQTLFRFADGKTEEMVRVAAG